MDKTSEGLRARLKWLLETSGLSAREASKRAKQSSPAYIGMLLRGDIDDTKTRTVEDIAAVFGVTPAWLAYGDGPSPADADVRRHVQGDDGPTVDRSGEFAQAEPTDGAL
jgi:hypothetical protein